jgi:hypothetical protein
MGRNRHRKDFLFRTQEAQHLRERIDKWDYIRLKNFCTKKLVPKLKKPSTEWEKIFASYTSDKGLITSEMVNNLAKEEPLIRCRWEPLIKCRF